MARVDDELFDEDAIVAERGFRLGFRAREPFGDFEAGMGDAHCPCRRRRPRPLDHHGIADFVGDSLGGVFGAFDHAHG